MSFLHGLSKFYLLAVGLKPGGVGHFKVLENLRESGGVAVSVDEATIAQILTRVYKDKGWWICPEGAAGIAAVPLVEQEVIARGDRVTVFIACSFEKNLHEVRHLLIRSQVSGNH